VLTVLCSQLLYARAYERFYCALIFKVHSYIITLSLFAKLQATTSFWVTVAKSTVFAPPSTYVVCPSIHAGWRMWLRDADTQPDLLTSRWRHRVQFVLLRISCWSYQGKRYSCNH